MPRVSKREQLINASMLLFYENGFHATGIDKILVTAKVSKKTMYQYFRSKDELIYAALRHYDSVFRNQFMKDVEASGRTPIEKLRGVFDVLERQFTKDVYFGCLCTNAIAEYSAKDSMVREIANQCASQIRAYVAQLAKEANLKEPDDLADQLYLIYRGACTVAHVSQSPQQAHVAKRIADRLIDQAS